MAGGGGGQTGSGVGGCVGGQGTAHASHQPNKVNRTGHAPTQPRQRDHVFRPQKMLDIELCPNSLRLFHLDTEFFIFLGALKLYDVVAFSRS